MHKEEMRLQMDVAIGKAPPLTEDQLQDRLREEAHVRGLNLRIFALFCVNGCWCSALSLRQV